MRNSIKIGWTYIRTFFRIDFYWKSFLELLFPLSIAGLIALQQIYPSADYKSVIVLIFLLWSMLAMIGFFIPIVKNRAMILIPGEKKTGPPNDPGIPVIIKWSAKGAFIASKPIRICAKIVNLQANVESKNEFKKCYKEFSIAFFNSVQLPLKKGRYCEGDDYDAGGVTINMDKLRGSSSIYFSSPGAYLPVMIYKYVDDDNMRMDPLFKEKENLMFHQAIVVSPPEVYLDIRNQQITYSLTIVVTLLALMQFVLSIQGPVQ